MGWDFSHRAKGTTTRAFIKGMLSPETEIVAQGMHGSTWYAAIRSPRGTVYGLVVLTQYDNRVGSYHNFGVKFMDETMGPNEAHAPKRVLQALTENNNPYAQEWRAACWKNLERAARAKAVAPGSLVRLPRAIEFVGFREDTFRLVEGNKFVAVGANRLVRLPEWRSLAFEVVAS